MNVDNSISKYLNKLLFVFLAAFVAVLLVGCSSGEDKEQTRLDFIDKLTESYSFTEEQANAAYDLIDKLGCGDIKLMDGAASGTDLDVIRGEVNKHQVNITADNKKIFYVQITGWKENDYDWYINWRGKLKYQIIEKKIAFDLYDSDTVSGGYIAYYDARDDSVIPWSEHQ